MPWNETCVMDLKMQLIADWLRQESSISELARGYGLSRKTVYKWVTRYQDEGASGLQDRSRAPKHCPHAVADEVADKILAAKRSHPSFGPKKVMDLLRRKQPQVSWPADSTAGDLLKAAGLVKNRRYKKPYPADPQPFELGDRNNALWSVDYKGQYPTTNGRWCYPLTLTDNGSRYLLCSQGVTATDYAQAKPILEWTFKKYGLPEGIDHHRGVCHGACCDLPAYYQHLWFGFTLGFRTSNRPSNSASRANSPNLQPHGKFVIVGLIVLCLRLGSRNCLTRRYSRAHLRINLSDFISLSFFRVLS
ncbi:helix-turn-helix domain-containing protein [Saccharophagus sp. K07]|uniref:helix-turn-helix domain-containing protein n=1 Tax=Saccharophagus sp. K07 TaxID=2283636 RepID=UPI001CA37382|nr:helix-turn-helix domain-containing protein [Saccharophagus sp. K07]